MSGDSDHRRRVPADIAGSFLEREFKRVLGPSAQEAPKAYPQFHETVEREIDEIRQRLFPKEEAAQGQLPPRCLRAVPLQAVAALLSLGGSGSAEDDLREVFAETPERDERTLLGHEKGHLLRNAEAAPPEPTLADARRRYLADKRPEKKIEQRVNRVFRVVHAALKGYSKCRDLRRERPRDVLDLILNAMISPGARKKPSPVKHDLNTIRAVVNHALREFGLWGTARNPFGGLKVPGVTVEDEGGKTGLDFKDGAADQASMQPLRGVASAARNIPARNLQLKHHIA